MCDKNIVHIRNWPHLDWNDQNSWKRLITSNIIIITMKNFNRRDSYGQHGSKRRKLVQHATCIVCKVYILP